MINRIEGIRILRALQRGLNAAAPPSPQRLAGPGVPATHLYPPERRPKTGVPPLVMVPGIARLGAEDPRVVALARAVAQMGYTVLVPDLPRLRELSLPPGGTRLVGDALAAVRAAAGGRVGVIGFCYGASTVLAAQDPGVAAYLLVGPVVNVREVLLRPRDPYVGEIVENSREGGKLTVAEVVGRAEAELDPLRCVRGTRVPVFVLHGAADPIERPEEGERLAHAAPNGYFLKTPLIGHADLAKARLRDAWRLAHFLALFLDRCAVEPVDSAAPPVRRRLFGGWRRKSDAAGADSLHRVLVLDHLRAVAAHDAVGMAHGLALGAVYDLPAAGLLLSREQWVDLHRGIWAGVPDFKLEVGQVVEGDGRVVVEIRVSGTNRGGFMGVAGNGRAFDLRAVALFEIRDDRIARETLYYDHATVLRQLGAPLSGAGGGGPV